MSKHDGESTTTEECRPAIDAQEGWYWVGNVDDGRIEPWYWLGGSEGSWRVWDDTSYWTPDKAERTGWRYLGAAILPSGINAKKLLDWTESVGDRDGVIANTKGN